MNPSPCKRRDPSDTYDCAVNSSEGRSTRVVPDGIIAHRASVRKRGGLTAGGIALALAAVGLVFVALPGALFGLIGFVIVVMAMPTLPMFGVPAVSGVVVYLLAGATSLGLWFVIGHISALRATRRAVSGWKEWRSEFRPLALGVWLGGLAALVVATIVVGAL
jgi:hypothetical protein